MRTKTTIKCRHRSETEAGFHLYEGVIDDLAVDSPGADKPVYLELDGVDVELAASEEGGVTVTVKLPREMAVELGLVPRYRIEGLIAECQPLDGDR